MNINELLEPGGLFKSALFGTLLRDYVDVVELAPGVRVGAYSIEGQLGRGGMGIVYRGQRADGQFEQHVAIKVLGRRVGGLGIHESFRRERAIVAALNHAHIAHLLDGGVMEDGRLWFAVELIEGPPINRYCVERRLNVRQRVELVRPIVDAVQYAHSHLLIHSDIKPSNVLVDPQRGAKLLDFGVATFLHDNNDDIAVGCTPGYASPEQLAGERIGTASDIWQLGNLLRIVLCAHAEGEVALAVPRDLMAIIEKACAHAISARYITAKGLNDDIERFLSHKPVHARRLTMRYRAACFAQRYPFGVAAIGVALLLLAGVIALGWRLSVVRSLAQNEHDVSKKVTSFLTDDLLAEANPYGGGGHSTVDLGNALSKASERGDRTFAGHPHLASQIDLALATALDGMSRMDEVHKVVRRALARLNSHDAQDFELVTFLKLLDLQVDIDVGKSTQARHELVEMSPEVADRLGSTSQPALEIQMLIGITYHQEHKAAECEGVLRGLLAHQNEIPPIDRILMTGALSHCAMWLGHFDEAMAMAETQARSASALYGDTDPRALIARSVISTVAYASGDFPRALAEGRALIDPTRTALGPDNESYADLLYNTGGAAVCTGDYDEAIRDLDGAMAIRRKLYGDRSLVVAGSFAIEGLAYTRMHNWEAAERSFAEGSSMLKQFPDSTRLTSLLVRRGELRLDQSRYADAADDFDQALGLERAMKSDTLLRAAPIKLGLAIADAHIGRKQEASVLIREAMASIKGRPVCWQPFIEAAKQLFPKEMQSERLPNSLPEVHSAK